MALIVEDGTGKDDAESYVSVAETDAYHTARGNTTWTGDASAKEAALRRATQFIDTTYRRRWPGSRVNGRAQSLDWPRTDVVDGGGNDVDDASIPPEIWQATAEAALRELISPGSLTPDVVAGQRVVQKTVGPITVRYADDGKNVGPVLTIVDGILEPILLRKGANVTFFKRA
jgi:hypothetical protein